MFTTHAICKQNSRGLICNVTLKASIYSRRLVHSDKANRDDGVENTVTTPAQAEKMPVFIDNDLVANMLDNMKDDMPVSSMPDPFKPEQKRCILCKHNIDVDYKNVRLLSQFVSHIQVEFMVEQ
ncbi:hypothetical protein C0Q70_10336 [Pomacea canaliculata]|uniref:Uncharacterized protein n=1 Tax=Pomacea canaliculata TaxID=400727 RepID=A0A2T7PCB9_POMCA|nr:hypothetical protein C0Q70_10336 [Pomacea canaliculata]